MCLTEIQVSVRFAFICYAAIISLKILVTSAEK